MSLSLEMKKHTKVLIFFKSLNFIVTQSFDKIITKLWDKTAPLQFYFNTVKSIVKPAQTTTSIKRLLI